MGRRKKRPFTESERSELRHLSAKGRSGTITQTESIWCDELYAINPEEYGEVNKAGRRDADMAMNPLLEKDES